jgi:adsorption protein B
MRDSDGQLVATREYFPDNLKDAVRQKARWIVGISLAGWDRMGWQGGPAEWWMRMRDRAAALSAFILFTAYLALLLWGVLLVGSLFSAFPVPKPTPTVEALLWIDFGFMIWRMAMRAIFSGMAYGWVFGLGAIPRTFIANIVAMTAARRAMFLYLRSLIGRPLTWDKTRHRFPDLESPA